MFVKFITCDNDGLSNGKVMIRIKDIAHLMPAINYSWQPNPSNIMINNQTAVGYSPGTEIRTPIPGATCITMINGAQWTVLMDFDEISSYISNNEREDV